MDGYEVCRRIRENPDTAFLPVVMITASGDAAEGAGDRGRSRRLRHQAVRPGRAARAGRVAGSDQALPGHDPAAGRRARGVEPRAGANASSRRSRELRAGESVCAASSRRRWPSSSSTPATSRSWRATDARSSSCSATSGRFTPFAESSEPEEVMGVLREYHAALGDLIFRFEGTLERFTGDGLMVFFNDPMPCEDAPLRAIRMAVAMRTGSATWPTPGRGTDTTSASAIGIAQGYATLGRIGFEGRFDYAAIGSVTNLAARLCAEARAVADPRHRSGCSPGPRTRRQRRRSAIWSCAASAGRCAPSTSRARHGPDRRHERRSATAAVEHRVDLSDAQRGAALRALRPAPGAACRRCGTRCASTIDDESVVVIPSVTLDRLGDGSGSLTQAYEERFLFLLLLLRQPRLRMVYVTSMPIAPDHRRVLPGAAARRDPQPRPRPAARSSRVGDASPPTAQREAARAAPAAPPDRGARSPTRRRSHLVPYNTTELERDVALALGIPMYGADPRLVAPRHEDRLPPAVRRGGRPSSARASRTCTPSTRSPTPSIAMRRAAARDGRA